MLRTKPLTHRHPGLLSFSLTLCKLSPGKSFQLHLQNASRTRLPLILLLPPPRPNPWCLVTGDCTARPPSQPLRLILHQQLEGQLRAEGSSWHCAAQTPGFHLTPTNSWSLHRGAQVLLHPPPGSLSISTWATSLFHRHASLPPPWGFGPGRPSAWKASPPALLSPPEVCIELSRSLQALPWEPHPSSLPCVISIALLFSNYHLFIHLILYPINSREILICLVPCCVPRAQDSTW